MKLEKGFKQIKNLRIRMDPDPQHRSLYTIQYRYGICIFPHLKIGLVVKVVCEVIPPRQVPTRGAGEAGASGETGGGTGATS